MRTRLVVRIAIIGLIAGLGVRSLGTWLRARAIQADNAVSTGSTLARVSARPYPYRVPRQLDRGRRYPLVIALHGLGSNGRDFERYFGIDVLVDEMGFLAAFPDGTIEAERQGPRGFGRRFWNATEVCCDFLGSGVDDVGYLDEVIADMSARFPVDPKRIYLVGHSNGGYMSYRFACDHADRVAAIVSSAGAMWSDPARCHPSEPVAVLEIHGTEDAIVPYQGGPLRESPLVLKSAHQSVGDWVRFDGCAPRPEVATPPPNIVEHARTSVERWAGCRGVELWTLHGGVHSPDYRRPDFARAIGAWMAAHAKP